MGKIILAALITAGSAVAQQPSEESLRRGCGFDGSACAPADAAVSAPDGETDRLIEKAINDARNEYRKLQASDLPMP